MHHILLNMYRVGIYHKYWSLSSLLAPVILSLDHMSLRMLSFLSLYSIGFGWCLGTSEDVSNGSFCQKPYWFGWFKRNFYYLICFDSRIATWWILLKHLLCLGHLNVMYLLRLITLKDEILQVVYEIRTTFSSFLNFYLYDYLSQLYI